MLPELNDHEDYTDEEKASLLIKSLVQIIDQSEVEHPNLLVFLNPKEAYHDKLKYFLNMLSETDNLITRVNEEEYD